MVRQYDQFLKNQMQGKYSQLEAAKKDATNAMLLYKDLRPSCDRFVYNDGSSKNLVCLSGTVPVIYKGTTYNIPVAIWLQEPHPQTPPLCFVKPTNTMQVRQGRHVDANGRVYLPYLTEWRAGSHNLVSCIQIMIAVFGEEPPVYSKQTAPAQPQPQPYPSTQRLPYPPTGYPAQGPPTTNYQPNFGSAAPYPMTNVSQPTPYPTPGTATSFPPYPGYPPTSMPATPYPAATPMTTPLPQVKPSEIDDSMIKASLLTAVNDKLKRRMMDTLVQADSEMVLLKQTEQELQRGSEKLQSVIKRLENEIGEADANMVILQTKNEEVQKEIDRLQQRQDNLGVDDVVMATTPVYNQIVASFAEEQGLEDVIYYLGEALHKNVVDVDTFLKHVRNLSRQQFMLRAIIQKARKSAGLANVY